MPLQYQYVKKEPRDTHKIIINAPNQAKQAKKDIAESKGPLK
jgi:hypothetical protein